MSAEEIDSYYPFYILRVIADDSRAATNNIFFFFSINLSTNLSIDRLF